MRYFYCLVVLTFLYLENYAQDLLANGNFEEENICTEYQKNCAPEGWIGSAFVINYYFDTEGWAKDGSHFIGLITGSKEIDSRRSFIRSRLLCALRKGHQYKIEFYIRSRHPVFDSIGVYFSATDFLFETKSYRQVRPSVMFRDTITMPGIDTLKWKKVSLDYTATGEENFITIGSFKRQEYKFNLPPEYKGNYYLYLDDVSLTPQDPHELLCKGADSMRSIIYEENERHSFLERKIIFYRKNIPIETRPPLTLLQRIDTLIIPDILFATASAKLNNASFRVLDSFCTAQTARSIDSLRIDGHTDSVGTLVYNNKLAADRANAVSAYISGKLSLSEKLFLIHYYAYLRPVATNITPGGRQRNRRVEIYLYTHE